MPWSARSRRLRLHPCQVQPPVLRVHRRQHPARRHTAHRTAMSGQRGGLHTVGNYTLLEVVGQGTFGEVWSAVERHTRESVAVKILEKEKIVDDDARQRLVNEIAILQRVQHNNLVQLLEVIEEPDRIYLVTEYVGGGELFSYIVQKGRLDEVEAARLFAQMVAAVDSCHRQLVIHRDLKPENVLLDSNGDIKVIDFGLGTLLNYTDEVHHCRVRLATLRCARDAARRRLSGPARGHVEPGRLSLRDGLWLPAI